MDTVRTPEGKEIDLDQHTALKPNGVMVVVRNKSLVLAFLDEDDEYISRVDILPHVALAFVGSVLAIADSMTDLEGLLRQIREANKRTGH